MLRRKRSVRYRKSMHKPTHKQRVLRATEGLASGTGDDQTLPMTSDPTGLSQLGRATAIPESPEQAKLERAPNPHKGTLYLARFTAPEFTSICPVTGQPDFGVLVIDYAPKDWIVESKSLKLFLQSFRNHGAFHEDCTVGVAKRIVDAIDPLWLRIGGYWNPRGGMPIDVFWQTGEAPAGLWLPDQGVATYRARG